MNHRNICRAWIAYNLGLATVQCPARKRGVAPTTVKVRSEAKGARISYREEHILSHHWWDMARIVKNERGERAMLYRDDKYSNSTGKHQSHLRAAIAEMWHFQVFHIRIARQSHTLPHPIIGWEVLEEYKLLMDGLFDGMMRRRSAEKMAEDVARIDTLRRELVALADFYDLAVPPWSDPFEGDEAKRDKLEAHLTEFGVRNGVHIPVYWRQA